jgi:uncharacterized protein YjiS (DUF1127 family)
MATERIANPLRTIGYPGRRATDAVPGPLMRLWVKAVDAVERRRAVQHIAEMDTRMLKDIGVHPGNAEQAVRHGLEDDKRVMPWWAR